jgi:hypothetical protein
MVHEEMGAEVEEILAFGSARFYAIVQLRSLVRILNTEEGGFKICCCPYGTALFRELFSRDKLARAV